MTAQFSFRFLNKTGRIEHSADWNTPSQDKLWLYNLHYFDDLRAKHADSRTDWHRALITRWISDNPPGQGNGWEPYPMSLRIVNWIKWCLAGNELNEEMQHSLAVQCRFLRRSIEWHLLGNHVLANAKALVFAGLFFDGIEADEWYAKGLSIFEEQLSEQILPDGGHFELSPMYHSIILEDLLDLCNLAIVFPSETLNVIVKSWKKTIQQMRYWLLVMSHPDGQISFFNDAAFDIAASPSMLDEYARALGHEAMNSLSDGIIFLKQSGYIRVQQGKVVALLDVARIGPSYLPGHAHADTLTFELSVAGQRIIVNTGTSEYGVGQKRQYQRSTAAHNTIEIDGKNSCEIWDGFRVARRAYPYGHEVSQNGDVVTISCSHDGYQRLPGRNTVTRTWIFGPGELSVIDEVVGRFDRAIGRFHFHPDIDVELEGDHGSLTQLTANSIQFKTAKSKIRKTSGVWCPAFGVERKNECLEISNSSNTGQIKFMWGTNL